MLSFFLEWTFASWRRHFYDNIKLREFDFLYSITLLESRHFQGISAVLRL